MYEPIKIKRIRAKKFTQKRNPYKIYQNAEWNWSDILTEIDNLKSKNEKNYIRSISNKYGIKYSTLKYKYHQRNKNKINFINEENRGGVKRIFTNVEEKDLFIYIKTNYIDKNLPLCNEDIKTIALDKFKLLKTNKNINFKASNGWCSDFKKKWRLCSVTPKISRISIRIYTDKEINDFIYECNDCLIKVGRDFFFNLDETTWRNINIIQKTIRIKGDKNSKININSSEKEGFTLILTITASGKFLTPILVAKGKTYRSLKKFNLNRNIVGTYSNNGWVNKGIMKIALKEIHKIAKGQMSFLLLDQFTTHKDEFIIKEANKYNIKLIYVPKGKTSILQPLDVSINGILKEKAKRLWKQERIKYPNKKITVSNGVKHFLVTKNEISKKTIIRSFEKSCFNKNILI